MSGRRSRAGPDHPGRLAQRESTAFTRQGSLVRSQYRPPRFTRSQARHRITGAGPLGICWQNVGRRCPLWRTEGIQVDCDVHHNWWAGLALDHFGPRAKELALRRWRWRSWRSFYRTSAGARLEGLPLAADGDRIIRVVGQVPPDVDIWFRGSFAVMFRRNLR
jgi:hypothetical protein